MERKERTRTERFVALAFKGIFGFIAIIAFAFLIGYGVMLLWNWLIPDIFGVKTITYWQAVGMLVLAKVLFGGFGGNNSKRRSLKSRNHWRRKMNQNCRSDAHTWKYYDKFWEEEGKSAYSAYVARKNEGNSHPPS